MSNLKLSLYVLIPILTFLIYLIGRWFARNLNPKTEGTSSDSAIGQIGRIQGHSMPGPPPGFDAKRWEASIPRLSIIAFSLSIGLYVFIHFIALERFPITFFADEAAQTVLAADLIDHDFRYEGDLLPTYFYNVDKYSLSVTVYFQIIPYLLFGKSVIVTRSTSVLIGLAGAVALSLALKKVFRTPYWWSGVLLLAISPAWFMHSRTAFEAPIAAALYGIFLFSYFLYLYRSPRYVSLVLITGALTFYSYNPARVILVATGILLLISDIQYHWKLRRLIFRHWWLIILCLMPYVRFQITHPFSGSDQLYLLNSYWVQDISISDKFLQLGYQFARGLNPFYWYLPHEHDLIRHVMKGYGHLLWITFPLFVAGMVVAFKNVRTSAYRVLLIALFTAPLGGAMVEPSITRLLPTLAPMILLTAIGLSTVLGWVTRSRKGYLALSIALLSLLASVSLYMTLDALKNGATWFKDYGLYGMQYGSPEVFEEINTFVENSPGSRIIASPYWANGTSMLARFFMEDLEPLRWGVIHDILAADYPIQEDDIFMMLPQEYEKAQEDDKIEIEILKIIEYPDGRPGFIFARIDLVDPSSNQGGEVVGLN